MIKRTAIALLMMFTSHQAFAGFELRLNYGMLAAPKSFNTETEKLVAGYPAMGAVGDMGVDALYVLPVMPLVVGLRYESMSAKASGTIGGSPYDTKFTGTRASLLGGYRFLNTLGFLGVLAHVGVSSTGKYSSTQAGVTDDNKATIAPSYGLGLEGGVKLMMFLVGAEVGYTSFKAPKLTDDTGATVATSTGGDLAFDLSGPYFRAMVGLTF